MVLAIAYNLASKPPHPVLGVRAFDNGTPEEEILRLRADTALRTGKSVHDIGMVAATMMVFDPSLRAVEFYQEKKL